MLNVLKNIFDAMKVQMNSICLTEIFSKIINAFTFTFDQFNASLLNKSIKNCTLAF